ncbi:uncharacterized protein LOC133917824 [Phragmites australis]|uniref:uncharacterized protein LOC133917824 n=1 Tax=Phragmites australis TaxID=29695 RepID=UPI002D786620|nr:uncharacterized protein LOC133917824 [Phragmites australis]
MVARAARQPKSAKERASESTIIARRHRVATNATRSDVQNAEAHPRASPLNPMTRLPPSGHLDAKRPPPSPAGSRHCPSPMPSTPHHPSVRPRDLVWGALDLAMKAPDPMPLEGQHGWTPPEQAPVATAIRRTS